MSAWFSPAMLPQDLATVATTVVDLALKLGLLVLVACVAERAFRRSTPAVRHRLWLVVAVGALLLPLGDFFPQYGWRFVARPDLPTDNAGLLAPTPRALAVVSLWLAGALAAATWYLLGALHLRGLVRRSRPVREPAWRALLHELKHELGVTARVRLLMGDIGVPLAFRAGGNVILLPETADEWSVARRRVVLLHELMHVRRCDHRVERILAAVCTLFWFHPGAWLTARRLRLERERACDELVVHYGRLRASDYAEHLVGIARDFIGLRYGALVTADAMARTSTLEQRLRSILATGRPGRTAACPGDRLLTGALAAGILWFVVTPILPHPCVMSGGIEQATAPAAPVDPARAGDVVDSSLPGSHAFPAALARGAAHARAGHVPHSG